MPIGAGIPIIGPTGPAIGPIGAPGSIAGGPPSKLPCGLAPGGRWTAGTAPEIYTLQQNNLRCGFRKQKCSDVWMSHAKWLIQDVV